MAAGSGCLKSRVKQQLKDFTDRRSRAIWGGGFVFRGVMTDAGSWRRYGRVSTTSMRCWCRRWASGRGWRGDIAQGEGRRRRAGARRRSRNGAAAASLGVWRAARARPGVRAADLPRDPGRLGPPPAGCAADAAERTPRRKCGSPSRAPRAPTGTRPRCSISRVAQRPVAFKAYGSFRADARSRDRRPRRSRDAADREHHGRIGLRVVRSAAAVQSVAGRRRDRRRAALPARRRRTCRSNRCAAFIRIRRRCRSAASSCRRCPTARA